VTDAGPGAAPGAAVAVAPAPAPARASAGGPGAGVLVVGYGNPLRGDDGAGPRAAALVAEDPRLAGATVLARHQLTPELADEMRTASLVVLVDARAGAEPGTVVVERIEPEPASAVSGPAAGGGRPSPTPAGAGPSSHHVDPAALAGLARVLWGANPEIVVVGVGAGTFETGDPLSPEVERALPAVLDAIASLVAEHGRA
jgi:hydrogenase maturation protease